MCSAQAGGRSTTRSRERGEDYRYNIRDIESRPTELSYGDTGNRIAYTYDGIGRMSQRVVTLNGTARTTTYGYAAGSNGAGNTTSLLSRITPPTIQYLYSYDNRGNIIAWTQDDVTVTYEYDIVGQLIRVNDPTDGSNGTTWTYAYDRGGNILNKKRYAYTVSTLGPVLQTITYGYDTTWKDKLVSYDGAAITYDAIGNPLNDGTWTYVWENGRQLKQMSKAGTTATFDYNHDGLRVRKTVIDSTGTTVTNYTLHGKNIVHMTRKNAGQSIDDSLHFFYDASGKPAIVEFNGTKYAYVHDLQGDICQIVDANGNVVVEYTYDAWGKVLSTTGSMVSTLGTIQPFRYRGYVYDVETGLYYLRSRYYNVIYYRFLNLDSVFDGVNLFCYCGNAPSIYTDFNGTNVNTTNCRQVRVRSRPNAKKDNNIITDRQTNLKKGTQVEVLFSANGTPLRDDGTEAQRSNMWYYIAWYNNGYHSGYVHSSCLDEVEYSSRHPDYSGDAFGSSVLKLKSTGYEVYNAQVILYHLGYLNSPDECDGLFGTNTKSAVKSFQSANYLSVDGEIGDETRRMLWKLGEEYMKNEGVAIPNG